MRVQDLHPGDRVRSDLTGSGYREVQAIELNDETRRAHVIATDGQTIDRDYDVDMIMYEPAHPNTVDVLEAVYRELTGLLHGPIDAPVEWRWTAQRIVKRVSEILPAHRRRDTEARLLATEGSEHRRKRLELTTDEAVANLRHNAEALGLTTEEAATHLRHNAEVLGLTADEVNPFRNVGKPLGYLWTKSDGTELLLDPDEVQMVVGPEDSASATHLRHNAGTLRDALTQDALDREAARPIVNTEPGIPSQADDQA